LVVMSGSLNLFSLDGTGWIRYNQHRERVTVKPRYEAGFEREGRISWEMYWLKISLV